MGKKDQAEMDRQRSRFIDGAAENKVDAKLANDIFDLVNEFAGYGFNKSHAAAYAMISFRTAYLKAVYPTEILAQFYQEAKRMEIGILPPCVNHSGADFEVEGGQVRYALGALKNVGLEAMRHVVNVREAGGPFTDLFDFARRIDARIVNKRAIENLARGGAFDALEPNRAKILGSASILQSIGSRASEERNSNQGGLFGGGDIVMAEPDLAQAAPWGAVEQLDHELGAVGC
jgi:DNA polymerase-3 subunit alpha